MEKFEKINTEVAAEYLMKRFLIEFERSLETLSKIEGSYVGAYIESLELALNGNQKACGTTPRQYIEQLVGAIAVLGTGQCQQKLNMEQTQIRAEMEKALGELYRKIGNKSWMPNQPNQLSSLKVSGNESKASSNESKASSNKSKDSSNMNMMNFLNSTQKLVENFTRTNPHPFITITKK